MSKVSGWDVINKVGFDEITSRYDAVLFGNLNVAPFGFHEVTEAEFATDHHHTAYQILATDYRQLTRYNDESDIGRRVHGSLRINAFGKGWMLEQCHHEKKVRYYFFELCAHEYETIEKAMCWWKGRCKKCGMIHAVDSSD